MSLLRNLSRRLAAIQSAADPDAPAAPPEEAEIMRGRPIHATVRPAHVIPPVSALADPPMPENWLKRALDQQDNAPEQSRTGHTGYTHVSTIAKAVCVREYALAANYSRQASNALTGGHRLLFAYGRTAENHIRETAIRAFNGAVYGRWKCACGRTEHVGTRPGITCGHCEKPVDRYREEPVFNHEFRVVGNPDLPIMIGRNHMAVVEIKSLPGDEWRDITAPKSEHITQAVLYAWMKRTNGFTVHDNVVLLYASRNFRWGSPYKEFHVRLSDPAMQERLALSLEAAAQIKDALANRTVPPRLACCTAITDRRARDCPQAALCMNLPNDTIGAPVGQ